MAEVTSRSPVSPQCGHAWVRCDSVFGTRCPHRQCWESAVSVVLMRYGTLVRPGGCFPGQPILPYDSDYLKTKINELDDWQRQLAAARRIDYFDTRPMSQGHDICAPPGDRYIEGYEAKEPAAPLHPNAFGAAAVGTALAAYIDLRLTVRRAGLSVFTQRPSCNTVAS
jgi:hypothetical protein